MNELTDNQKPTDEQETVEHTSPDDPNLMTEEELIAELFGEEYSKEFREKTNDLFSRAVYTYTAELREELESQNEIIEELAMTVLANEERAIFDEVAHGLPVTSKDRFRTLTEALLFDDPDAYKLKLRQARQMHFPINPTPSKIDYDSPLDEPKKAKALDPLIEASVKHLKDYRS